MNRDRSNSWDKRKRDNTNSPEKIFRKSKKTARSPERKGDTGEMDEIKQMLSVLVQSMNEVKEQMTSNHDELKKEIKNNRDSIEKMKKDYEERDKKWQKEKEEMKATIQVLNKRIEAQDRRTRSNNVIVSGLKNVNMAPIEMIKNLFKNELQVECNIKSASILKRQEASVIIIAELDNRIDKINIMENKSKLKGKDIYIDNDYTQEEREIQRSIRMRAKEEKQKGKRIKIFYNKLMIEDKMWVWNALSKILEEQPQQYMREAKN